MFACIERSSLLLLFECDEYRADRIPPCHQGGPGFLAPDTWGRADINSMNSEVSGRRNFTPNADVWSELAAVLRQAGRKDEAGEALQEALRLQEARGNLVSAARTRETPATLAGP
jgi:hypothetical protein